MNKISDAEWEVMKVLWEKAPLTASEIIEKIRGRISWNPKTIHTLINRLVNKGAIGVNKSKTFYRYKPLISEDECKKNETRSFIEKVYDGSGLLLVKNFLINEKLSVEEIEQLKRILDKK